MYSHDSQDEDSLFTNDIDLSDIFIGREHQLNQFQSSLQRWFRIASSASIPIAKAAPSPNGKIQGMVVLIYGRGGFGKTTLLKHFREIALEYDSEIQVSDLIDWEFAAQNKRSLFTPALGESIDANQYFSLILGQFAVALGKHSNDFKEYQASVRAVEDAKKQAGSVLDGLQRDERYRWIRGLTREALFVLICSIPGLSGMSVAFSDKEIGERIREKMNNAIDLGADKVGQIRQIRTLLQDKLGAELDDYLDPAWRLGKGIGSDLAQFARRQPLIIFFDTYEEIDEGDKLLQMIMGAAGGRVGWVIAGRDNLWSGVEQRRRSLELEYGYKDLVMNDRRMVVDFSNDGAGYFTSSDIEEYFRHLSRKAIRLNLSAITEKDAAHIRDVTGGVPLAVKIAAGLYLESQDLTLVTESLDGKREIVDQMVERYLLHTRTNTADRARLYGLALLRRTEDQYGLSAALDVPGNYDAELSRLQRRYGFIFTKQEQPALHQEVRHFLRLWLLNHRIDRLDILPVISRLKDALLKSFHELEVQRHYTSLRERLKDEQWIRIYLDLTEQQFWFDPSKGVEYVLPFMLAASVYNREANREARTIGEFFQGTLVQPQRQQWDWANQSLVYTSSRNPLPEELAGLKELLHLVSENKIAFAPPVPLFREELEAALWWRVGEANHGKSLKDTVYWYKKASARLPNERDLTEALAEAKSNSTDSTTTNDAQKTIEDFDHAIERDPKSVGAYIQRGDVHVARKEYLRAIVDYERALELDTQNVSLYVKRGDAYLLLKEYRRAIDDFDHALEFDKQDVSLYARRGDAYLLLKEYRRAINDFDRVLEADPNNEEIRAKQIKASTQLTGPSWNFNALHQSSSRPTHMPRRAFIGIGIAAGSLIIGSSILFQHLHSSMIKSPSLTGKIIQIYQGHSGPVHGITWSPDGMRIASGGNDSTVQIWEASTGKNLYTYKGHKKTVWTVNWSPDGKRIASSDGIVQIWDAKTYQSLFTYKAHSGGANGVSWSPDGNYFATGGDDKTVQIWDAKTYQSLFIYKGHSDRVNSVKWSPDSKRIASTSLDRTVHVWEAFSGHNLVIYAKHSELVHGANWSIDGKRILTPSDDNTVRVWNSYTGDDLKVYVGHTNQVYSAGWSPNGKLIASGSEDGTAQVWDGSTYQTLYTYHKPNGKNVLNVAWSPNSKYLALGSRDSTVQIWQLPSS